MRAAGTYLTRPLVRRAAPLRCGVSAVCGSSPHLHVGCNAPVPLATSARRYTTLTRSLRQSWKKSLKRPWMCPKPECRATNFAGAMICESCATQKPTLLGWKCVDCGSRNFDGVKKCKACGEPAEKSKDFWMCAVCHENNRVDEMEDNSRCGHCGYDMAPPSLAEETILERAREQAAARQQQQEGFDAISYNDADAQLSDPLDGAEALDPSLRTRYPAAPLGRSLKLPTVKPFVASEQVRSRHSPMHRGRGRVNTALQAVRDAAAGLCGPPGFDWMCRNSECGQVNPGDEEACIKCGTKLTPTEWECPRCAAMNHLTRSRCFNCRNRIPVCWTCGACHANTSIYDRACRSCGADRPLAEPKTLRDVERGDSTAGTFVAQGNRNRGDWYCPSCSALNFSRRSDCYQCSAPRPPPAESAEAADPFAASGWGDAGAAGAAAEHQVKQDNNWICSRCQASNFRTRHDCWKCGSASDRQQEWETEAAAPHFEREGFQEGTSSKAAESPTSQQSRSSGEWVCAKCYTKNFKHRGECFRCGSRKVAVTAARSGARKPVKL